MERKNIDSYPSIITPGVDLIQNPGDHLLVTTTESIAVVSKQLSKRIIGQLSAEHDDFPKGVPVVFCCYADGDFYVWFVENFHFILIAHVEDRTKALAIIPVDHGSEFMQQVNDVANKLNLKHGYPIEEPESFKPGGENPPDEENSR